MRTVVRSLALLISVIGAGFAWGQATAPPVDLLQTLRAGGYVIVFRHGATHPDQADTDPWHPENIAKQRQLNDKGRMEAKMVGEVLRAARVPIGKSYSSQFHRAVETARLIGGKEPQTTPDVTEGGLVVSPNENNRRTQALRVLLGAMPDPGTNTLIVTHKPNIIDALGKEWFEVKEGEASVFKPDPNGKSVLIARIQIDEWAKAGR